VLALALASPTQVSLAPPTATADQSVVTATIYTSSGGGVTTPPPVTLSTLGGCPAYDGSNPMYSYPGGQPFVAPASSWAISTVLGCALQVPLSDVTDVQISSPTDGFETPLSHADLSVPSDFEDSNSQPVISYYDGNEDPVTYFRPWRGGSDQNGRDEVTESSPVAIVVYENGPPLSVTATEQSTAKTTKRFSATVRDASGALIPASALTWSWNFGDGQNSSEPAPTHAFQAGLYAVTVQVSDQSAGTGGTATIDVTFSSSSATGAGSQSGAGSTSDSRSTTGEERSGAGTGGAAGGSTSGGAATSHATTSSGDGAGASAAAGGASSSTSSSTPASSGSARTGEPGHSTAKAPEPIRDVGTPPPAAASSPVVVGQLISNVTPLPATASPLVHLVPTPLASATVRRAIRSSSLPVLVGALAVALLLGLGAARELRWRRASA
jgi:hypothetical protein